LRVLTQFAVLVVLGGAAVGGWYWWNGSKPAPPAPQQGGGQALPVIVAPPRVAQLAERIESIGTARSNESVIVTAKQTGVVSKIAFEEGQKVRAGQVLVELDAKERKSELDQAMAELEQAKAARDEARLAFERGKQLRGSGSVTEARLEALESAARSSVSRVMSAEARIHGATARFDDTRVTSPFEGRLGLRQVSLGALVQPGAAITTLDDVSKIKLEFSVPENVLGKLKIGLDVTARAQAYGTRVFAGKITAIDTRVDPVTRAIRVNAMFDNADDALKPGLFLNVVLALAQRDGALIVPEEAIVPEGLKASIFVVKDGRAERRDVKLGERLPGEVEIVEGLAAGEQVVVRGVQKIRHNQPVAARPLGAQS